MVEVWKELGVTEEEFRVQCKFVEQIGGGKPWTEVVKIAFDRPQDRAKAYRLVGITLCIWALQERDDIKKIIGREDLRKHL